MTPVKTVYDAFFTLITDDMYLEITEEKTREDCWSLLNASIPLFEFPDKAFSICTLPDGALAFDRDLTLEEVNILAYGMVQIWLQRQITSIEVIRQKFSGTDFKLSSQASHLQRLMSLMTTVRDEHRRLQLLHSRRRINQEGVYESTFDGLVGIPKLRRRRY